VLDLDVTDDQVHGHQSKPSSTSTTVASMPRSLFCGKHLLAAKRPANVDPAEGALEELQRVISLIRTQWQKNTDSGSGDVLTVGKISWLGVSPKASIMSLVCSNARLMRSLDPGKSQS